MFWLRHGVGRANPTSSRHLAAYFQVVAHPDDDLFFLNPAVQHAIDSGSPVTAVYLTASESDGRNAPQNHPDRRAVPVDFAGYAAARQNGIRAAYAQMALGDRRATWSRVAQVLAGGLPVEIATLVGAPAVRLVFFNLRTQDAVGDEPPRWLSALWEGSLPALPALRPTGSPLEAVGEYDREQLLTALTALLREVEPTVVRLLDPDPDHKTYDAASGKIAYSDHLTHTASAYFALEAVRRYELAGGRPVLRESYRGYYNRHWPRNLGQEAFAAKKALLDIYGGVPRDCGDPVGCGDYQVGDQGHVPGYGQSTHPRYPGSGSWLLRQVDGRLAAFGVLGDRASVWRETRPGSGKWRGPDLVDGAGLVPHLYALVGADARIHLFGVRQVLDLAREGHRRVLVTTVESEPGGPFGPWVDLGNPADGAVDAEVRRLEMGMPVAAVGADGRVQVFVRNFGRGVSSRVQTGPDTWGPWRDLGGSVVQEGLAVTSAADGRIELFAGTDKAVLHWRQATVDGQFERPSMLSVPAPAGPLTVVEEPGGRLLLVFREAESGRVLALRQRVGGGWPVNPASLDGRGGFGPVAAAAVPRDPGGTVLVKRDDTGTTSLSWQPAGRGVSTAWSTSGVLFVGSPAVAVDADGRVVAGVVGVDGRLWTARQRRAGSGEQFGEWTATGNGRRRA
ncbi:PIG-L family deacetylase [Micromonospora hortensis]|uniref:PIG-L family deacetylase n=1 Tax=Micromonospora hortensis TaxID=2911209 RepID=UPI001EE81EBB|nr:PIG-L family deacetylase [Micromonospora hortensis]MCG5448637.1 PIG-L family deacetylase [Micromonospora hortensis]